MRKSFTRLFKLILLVLTLVGLSLLNSFGQEYKDGILQGTIRIKIKPTIASAVNASKSDYKGIVTTGIQTLDKLNSTYSVTSMKRVFPYSPKFEERHVKHGLHLWYEVTISAKASSVDVVKAYSNLQEVEIAEPIHEIVLVDGGGKPIYVPSVKSERTTTLPFNDPYLPRQWHYNNTGQTGGTPGADINLFNAWNITHGTSNVIVSIHDQGVQANHDDLAANMWTNVTELNGETGVDDDGNGYIDDIHGVNFASGTGTIDVGYHGTHVAGTVAGVNNNGIGICGVAGGSGIGDGARIMTCQILGGSHAADIPASYVYAADMGAVISQNSWGYSSPGLYNQAEFDAIDYFIAEAGNYPNSPMKGGVVIFAAGNSNWEYLSYPGAYPSVIAVSALGSQNIRANYSNYGDWVEISAPGGASDEDVALGTTSKLSNGIMSTLDKNSYGYLDGTSMACPHVSGIAALIVSKFGGSNFTNNDLKTHLLTGYNDIYSIAGNHNYINKLGVGAIDAFQGLATDGKLAPITSSDLTLTGIAQDFATLQWAVPSDPDDESAWSYQIIVSKDPITLSSIANAKIYTLSKPKGIVGESLSFEVKNLLAITKYYFAIRSLDRWGNISEFSNIISATTNKGPIASFDPLKPAINLTIDVTKQTSAKDSIQLLNSGEGLLRWTAIPRVVSTIPLAVKPALAYPKLLDQSAVPRGLKTTILSNDIAPLNAIQRDTAVEKGYVDEWNSLKMIGETNLKIPNSAATRFYVDNETGFNLTLVDQFIRYDSLTGPCVLEVYEGSDISSAKLLLAQEFRKTNNSGGYTPIKLNEQIYFEKGSYFWIAIHVPAGNRYPLGIGLERSSEYSNNCYMSLNVGKTWGKLEELYQDNRVVWAVFAYEFSQKLEKFVKLSPNSGIVESNKNVYIKAEVDGSTLINGTYKSNLVAYTNETGKSSIRVPINVTIKGHKPAIQSVKRTNFGNVIIGNSTLIDITFTNIGLGRFNFISPYVSIDNSQFTYVQGINTTFESGTSQTVTFKFTPNNAGNIYAYATLLDKDGNNYQFELFGAGLEPPVAVLDPASANYDNLAIGDTIKGQMVIKNAGKYPLDYYLPVFANGSNMESIPTDIHKFGYTTKIDSSESTFVWNDIASTGIKINDHFKGSGDDNIYWRLPLNFMFPFFGKNENAVYISKYGVLAFSIEGSAIWSMVPMHYKKDINPDRYISGCGFPMLLQDANFGNIYYKQESDKLIVQYDDCPYWDGTAPDGTLPRQAITFQMILYDNGNIKLFYKDVMLEKFELNSSLVAIEDQTKNDGLILNGPTWRKNDYTREFHWNNQSVISFISPGLGLYSNVTNPFGTILPNESKTINYTIATDSLYLLPYTENLVVVTNDPAHNPSIFSTTFNITSGGSSSVAADTAGFDFGSIYKGIVKTNLFTLFNSGKAVDTLKTATFDNNYFTLKGNVPEILKPERRIEYFVTIKSDAVGVFTDTLRMTTKNGTTIKIGLKGEITQGPVLNILSSGGSPLTSVTRFLAAGNSSTVNFKISNTGSADLKVTPVNNEWASITEVVASESTAEHDYSWKSSRDFGGPTYEWIEIVGNGGIQVTENLSAWEGREWTKGNKMPFTFNYYGLPYDSLFIGFTGIISFTGRQDSVNYFFGGPTFPDKRQPDNYIAPLWVFGGPDDHTYYPNSGIYYKFETDRVIVEFRDYNTNFTMGPPISFEVILYKNGMIKFQYKMPENGNNTVTPYGSIGIENIDGTKGITVAYYQSYVNSDMSIAFYPTRPYTIAPAQSKDFIMDLSAKELISNSYSDSIEFASNDPYNLHKKLPVKIVVSGTPQITLPEPINFGDVLVDPKVTSIVKEFEVKNPGSANFTISSLSQKFANDLKVETYLKIDNIWYWTNVANSGVFPNSVLAHQSTKFRVTLTPQTPKQLLDTLVLNTTLGVPVQKIAISAMVYNPPVVSTNVDTIKLYAPNSQFKKTEEVILGNLTGGYNLNYSLTMDYVRDTTVTTNNTIANNSTILTRPSQTATVPLSEIKLSNSNTKTVINTSKAYNRVLAYENATEAASVLGYGGSYAFTSATGFKAPTDGFNLTHVQTWFAPGYALNSKVKVTILGGSELFYDCKVLGTEEFTVTVTQPDLKGKLETFKLSKNVEFFPNEPFFILFAYEIACDHPQGVALVSPVVANRYYYGSGEEFYDLADASSLNKYGWIVRAAEEATTYTPWLVLDALESGTIAPTKADTLRLNFDASSAEGGDHYAKLKIQSNDAITPNKDVVLYMRKNNGPKYDSHGKYKITENQTLDFELNAIDYEGDNFTVALDENNPLLSLTVLDAGTVQNWEFTSKVKTLKFRYTPDYSCQGLQTFGITGTDEFNNITKTTITVSVNNVNRVPVAIVKDTLEFKPFGDLLTINPYDIFTDPDNDLEILEAVCSNSDILRVYGSGSNFLLMPLAQGKASIIFKVTDKYGATATNTVQILVSDKVTGINTDVISDMNLYPNPTNGIVNVNPSADMNKEVSLAIFNTLGMMVKRETFNVQSAETISFDMSNLPTGIYLLKWNNGTIQKTNKIIKQ